MARDYFARLDTIAISRKGLQDVLTEADGAVERLIRQRVAEAFPGDFVLGE
ncbi:MAG: inositol monophosphatase, partial [Alphaproteobacteria bacterium]|nr:inositol monophosphatase [Alphaproteobacteria bacterium]